MVGKTSISSGDQQEPFLNGRHKTWPFLFLRIRRKVRPSSPLQAKCPIRIIAGRSDETGSVQLECAQGLARRVENLTETPSVNAILTSVCSSRRPPANTSSSNTVAPAAQSIREVVVGRAYPRRTRYEDRGSRGFEEQSTSRRGRHYRVPVTSSRRDTKRGRGFPDGIDEISPDVSRFLRQD